MFETHDGLPPDADEEASYTMGYAEIYEQLIVEEELIYTIPAEDEDRFKKGLAVAKNRMNKKLISDGVASDTRILNFKTLPSSEAGCIDIQVSMTARGGVRIMNMRKPDPNF